MFNEIKSFCSDHNVILVAVTKTRSTQLILDLYNKGQRIFGENRVPELVEKQEELPKDIQWHMIGHLQSNKVKYIAPFVTMIHSGASLSLFKEINKRAKQNGRIIDVLLQIKVAQEDAKSGWEPKELLSKLDSKEIQKFENIRIRGVMGMATFTADKEVVRNEFSELKSHFDTIKKVYYPEDSNFDTLSMGMSGDYKIAIQEGATMVRIGSLLFQ